MCVLTHVCVCVGVCVYIVCVCVCERERDTERQSGLWHIPSVLSGEKVLVREGVAERRGVQLREEGAVGLPAETRGAVWGRWGAEWRGGRRGEDAEHSGSANTICSPGSRLWQAHEAVTWCRGGARLGVGVTLGPPEDPDLIMGLGSGLLGAVPVSHLEMLTWPWEDPGHGVLHPAHFLSDYFV